MATRKTTRPTPSPAPKRRIDLALQGGGSHGAFTWGVLDRLLEEEWLEIAGVSGTSAGAMNAVALAAGLMEGGRLGARAALRRYWERVSEASPFSALDDGPLGALFGPNNPWLQPWIAPWQQVAKALGSQLSPYQLNPLNLNPLREILTDTINFERVRGCHRTQLFIAATHVSTGELRVFRQGELTADMVMASACLPLLFQAVLAGLTNGFVYALIGLGLSVVFRGTRIINAMQGEFGLIAGIAGYLILVVLGLHMALAFVGGVIAGGVVGLLVETVLVRPAGRRGLRVQGRDRRLRRAAGPHRRRHRQRHDQERHQRPQGPHLPWKGWYP